MTPGSRENNICLCVYRHKHTNILNTPNANVFLTFPYKEVAVPMRLQKC
jgi:hypothetical protein